ncbi:hypothetical protein BDZ91DRAFT_800040 [Kalaharituber pfeilii]|nr:hypothetical protein BDZ91DRAFT_800040 [Kalaharituber pfeilii]
MSGLATLLTQQYSQDRKRQSERAEGTKQVEASSTYLLSTANIPTITVPREASDEEALGHCGTWNSSEGKLGIVLNWLEATTEGKSTSSVVVYLEELAELVPGRVRLGGKWLKSCRYEWDRLPQWALMGTVLGGKSLRAWRRYSH